MEMTRTEQVLWKYERDFYLKLDKTQAEAEAKADAKIRQARKLAAGDAWVNRMEARYS